ncbi:MAG: OB-fold domain-containing protein [Rhizobiaceae bacterium]|nr:OB-fold domain-containing protein [Rhizobiaceae bacterium]
MSYLPSTMPSPEPTPDDKPFWEACARRELRIQRCAKCGLFRHPPTPVCGRCGSTSSEWPEVAGTGTVFTYTIAYHPTHPALKGATPYNIAVVLLDGADEVRIVSNVIDAAPEEMAVGLPVTLVWEEAGEGMFLPRFRKQVAPG